MKQGGGLESDSRNRPDFDTWAGEPSLERPLLSSELCGEETAVRSVGQVSQAEGTGTWGAEGEGAKAVVEMGELRKELGFHSICFGKLEKLSIVFCLFVLNQIYLFFIRVDLIYSVESIYAVQHSDPLCMCVYIYVYTHTFLYYLPLWSIPRD